MSPPKTTPTSAAVPDGLQRAIATGRLVVITGTGVSVAAGGNPDIDGRRVTTWPGLLHHGVDHCERGHGLLTPALATSLHTQIDSGDLDFMVVAAEQLTMKLRGKSPAVYRKWLKETVGTLQLADPEMPQLLARLGGILATLNYDRLLEKATRREAITWQQADKVTEVLRGERAKAVLHLHGVYDEPDSVVLGLRSYDAVAGDAHAATVLRLFTLDRTLLFVGCGDTIADPNFARLVDWTKAALRDVAASHYLLCRDGELDERRRALPAWLTALAYGASYADLLPYLRGLGAFARPARPRRSGARGAAPDLGGELEVYSTNVESRHAALELFGFQTRLRVPIALDELYVPLQAMIDLRAVDGEEFHGAIEAERRLREMGAARDIPLAEGFHEAQTRGRRGLVILGDPGSGKTTHLKRLLLWCVRRGPASLGLAADVAPVFLPLRNLRDAGIGLDGFFDQEVDRLGLKAGFGRRLRARGRLLLLFDGLDELTDLGERATVARWVEEAAKTWPGCTPVVTCRFAGYTGAARLGADFLELHVRPLDQGQSEAFVRNWYRLVETAIDPVHGADEAARRAGELIARLRETDPRALRLLEMAGNPLLLANLCLVHRDRGALPKGRARLYDECIEVLLEHWRGGKGLRVEVGAEVGKRVLQPVAFWLHGQEERTRATEAELAPVLEPALASVRWPGGGAREFLRAVRDDSGLLTGWGPDHFGFMHLGFQEYLAAQEIRRRHLEGDSEPVRELAAHYGESWWQEVILILLARGNPSLFAPFMTQVVERAAFAGQTDLLNLVLEEAAEVTEAPFVALLERRAGKSVSQWQRQMTALRVLEQLGCAAALERLVPVLARHPSPEIKRWLRDRTAASARAEAGQVAVTERGGVELVLIPAGRFVMGSPLDESGRFDREGPQHEVHVPAFWMGRYPVTNEEYRRFLEANPDAEQPDVWRDRRFNGPRQPVVGVSWEEARRFAAWAGGRLPTEAEWEYAARAGTTVPYLIGATEADLEQVGWYRGNADGQPQPVGGKAANAWGLHDVLGNVWEWVEDSWRASYKGAPSDGSAWGERKGGVNRVLRGGSWFNDPQVARVATRNGNEPSNRFDDVGFRLARSLPSRP